MGNCCVTREAPVVDERYLKYAEIHSEVRRLIMDKAALDQGCDDIFRKGLLDQNGDMSKEEVKDITQRFIDSLHCESKQRIQAISDYFNDLGPRDAVTLAEFRHYMMLVLREIEADLRIKVQRFRPQPDDNEGGSLARDQAGGEPNSDQQHYAGGVGDGYHHNADPYAQQHGRADDYHHNADPYWDQRQAYEHDRSRQAPHDQQPGRLSEPMDDRGLFRAGPQAQVSPGPGHHEPQVAQHATGGWDRVPQEGAHVFPGPPQRFEEPQKPQKFTAPEPSYAAPPEDDFAHLRGGDRGMGQGRHISDSRGDREIRGGSSWPSRGARGEGPSGLRTESEDLVAEPGPVSSVYATPAPQAYSPRTPQEKANEARRPFAAVSSAYDHGHVATVIDDSRGDVGRGWEEEDVVSYPQGHAGEKSYHGQDELDQGRLRSPNGCERMQSPTTLDRLYQGQDESQDVIAGMHDEIDASPSNAKMSPEDMALLMEQDGLPLFVYNKYYYTESKRLMLNAERTMVSLVSNETEDDYDEQMGREASAEFHLSELHEIQLGHACNFARILQQQPAMADSTDALVDVMVESQPPIERLAAFKFGSGHLCVRFLSSTLRDAAVDVFHHICPDVPIQGR